MEGGSVVQPISMADYLKEIFYNHKDEKPPTYQLDPEKEASIKFSLKELE